MSYEKFIRDGKVAVLYSPGYGAGWSTWNREYAEELLFDSRIVSALLNDGSEAAEAVAEELYPDTYTGGASDLQVRWLDPNCQFQISEYDGSESFSFRDSEDWFIA